MIEINLNPYAKKRSSKGPGFDFSKLLGALKGGGGGGAGIPGDPYIIFAVAAGVVSVVVISLMFLGLRSDREEVEVRLQEELDRYEQFRAIIERNNQLAARQDSIAQRVAIIQDIDAGRYQSAHVMDEVATALPDFTWLDEIVWVQDDPTQFRITGAAGQPFAVTEFLSRLEASPFLKDVEFEGTNQAPGEAGDIIYRFTMLATYESPPLEELRTVPLFGSQAAQSESGPVGGGS